MYLEEKTRAKNCSFHFLMIIRLYLLLYFFKVNVFVCREARVIQSI